MKFKRGSTVIWQLQCPSELRLLTVQSYSACSPLLCFFYVLRFLPTSHKHAGFLTENCVCDTLTPIGPRIVTRSTARNERWLTDILSDCLFDWFFIYFFWIPSSFSVHSLSIRCVIVETQTNPEQNIAIGQIPVEMRTQLFFGDFRNDGWAVQDISAGGLSILELASLQCINSMINRNSICPWNPYINRILTWQTCSIGT